MTSVASGGVPHSSIVAFNPSGSGFFVRNNGLPDLVDDTANFGVTLGDNRYFSVLLADFTGDMAPDMHVAVDFFPDVHWRNDGGGTFTDVSVLAGTTTGSSRLRCSCRWALSRRLKASIRMTLPGWMHASSSQIRTI